MKLMVLDGNSILNRAYYGIRPLSTREGLYTHAVYGFITTLQRLLDEENPEALCVTFDRREPTFRHRADADYKAQRKPMPPELAMQLPVMKQVLSAMSVPCYELAGYEADDLIGTISRKCQAAGWDCVIVTGDKDSLQLITDRTKVKLVSTRMGQTTTKDMTPETFREQYGFDPIHMIDLKALMGDTSDNIPGVPGVGEKTAMALVQEYGTIDEIYRLLPDLHAKPAAIRKLTEGVRLGLDEQVLLGVTGSGKTFTMASVIANLNRPTLVLAHNKTLAAQLCSEFREFFPENAVEYFISYYDYYQPEAYIAHTDTYIEKDSAINDEIERLRHSATSSLFERRDVIVVSSVSCIYGLGDPIDYKNMVISLRTGMEKSREELMQKLVEIRYERNDLNFTRNTFRVRGDTVEIYPVYWSGRAIRVEFFGDEIERITEFHPVTGAALKQLTHVAVYPASHYVTPKDKLERAAQEIERELAERQKVV